MPVAQPSAPEESEGEYRAIEAALLETARGRWFLAEHGRRARRLDSALLEDAIGRLQTSLREPPALLGQLEAEIGALRAYVDETRANLLARPAAGPDAPDFDPVQPQAILKAAEDVHDLSWSLQTNPYDPKSCEAIARNAVRLYVMSQSQAIESHRALGVASALDEATRKLDAMLETVLHEQHIDLGRPDQPLA
ncbi:MAG: hypothetical protein ACT4OU_11090 [Hyphomicrobium sp.]